MSGDVFYWIGLPYKLKDPGVFLHYDGTDDEGLHQVRVTFGEDVGDHDDTWFYAFGEGRAMPVSIGYREEAARTSTAPTGRTSATSTATSSRGGVCTSMRTAGSGRFW